MTLTVPTEPIGSIPRPPELVQAIAQTNGDDPSLEPLDEAAIQDTIRRFEETGSPVITDGEQRKFHNFWTYCVHGMPNTASDGFRIPFAAGHVRRMPRLTSRPFRCLRRADECLEVALAQATRPVMQAVISPSALSLMYPPEAIPGYPSQSFIHDLLLEHETDCPGGDRDSTHSADVDYADLLPTLFQLMAGNFYVALAGEPDRERVLGIIRDTSTSRDVAFAKIRARVLGTALAAQALEGRP